MKTLFKKSLLVLMVMFIAVISLGVTSKVKAATGYYEKVTSAPTDWSGEYLIVYEAGKVAFNGGLTSLDAVGNKISVTIADNKIEANDTTKSAAFTISKSGSNYLVKSKSGYYIGQTSNANGLKSNKTTTYSHTISMNSSDKSINLVSSSAYLRYNANSDQLRFRYYKSSSYTGQKAIHLYKYVEAVEEQPDYSEYQSKLDLIEAKMSLGYEYSTAIKNNSTELVTDILNLSATGIVANAGYSEWANGSSNLNSSYKGNSAGGNNSIQLRSSNSSGVVVTKSNGNARKIVVTWNSNTTSGRTLDIYGKNTPYSSAADLYDNSAKGTKIGSIVYGTSTELIITGDYKYIGLRSSSNAMYLNEIQITWEPEATTTEYSEVDFRIKCGVNKSIEQIQNIESYGVAVYTTGTPVHYSSSENSTYYYTNDSNYNYALISLGDVLNNQDRLNVEFNVCAYVVIDGMYLYSSNVKSYSLIELVKVYYEMADYKEQVTPLVEVLTSLGYSFE